MSSLEVVGLSTPDSQGIESLSDNDDSKMYSTTLIRERARLLGIITIATILDLFVARVFHGKGSMTGLSNSMTIVVLLSNIAIVSFLCFLFAMIFEFKLSGGTKLKYLTYICGLFQMYCWTFISSGIYGAIVTWILVYLLSSYSWTAISLFMRRAPTPGAKFLYALAGNTLLLIAFIVACSIWGKVQFLEFLLGIITVWLLLLFPVAKLLDTRVQCDGMVHVLYFLSIVGPLELIVGLTFNAVTKISELLH